MNYYSLMFNIDVDHELVTEAIIALDKPELVAWPLDEINEALADAYNKSLAIPVIQGVQVQFGPSFPTEVANRAIHLIMDQPGWPTDGAVYLYPVREGSSPLTSGIWLADTIDNVGDDDVLDDVALKMVRSCQTKRAMKMFPAFKPERFKL
jgi:hypothetical protein